jgi:hypothetical protein
MCLEGNAGGISPVTICSCEKKEEVWEKFLLKSNNPGYSGGKDQ